ncbi:MAG TPA: hypothetical protein VIG66_11245, partial [Noviherbaspirillum sp.]
LVALQVPADAPPAAAGLFDRPACLHTLHADIMPRLRSYPLPGIWLAEATSPEDVLALIALLHEHGLAHSAQIYVTAADAQHLEALRAASISTARFAACVQAYRAAGGACDLGKLVWMRDGAVQVRHEVDIVWAQHSLETDASFNEFDLVVCMRALMHFAPQRRARILRLFAESLPLLGMLALMPTLPAPHLPGFNGIVPAAGYYRRAL